MANRKIYADLFMAGANRLVAGDKAYTPEHAGAGISEEHWDIVTSDTVWSQRECQQVSGILSNLVSANLQAAGLAPAPLPGAYVAAVICKFISRPNRLIAAQCAPESFDAKSALGIHGPVDVKATTREQMCALVLEFSSDEFASLTNHHVDELIEADTLNSQG